MNTTDYTQSLVELGFSLKVLQGPTGDVKDNWPNILYRVQLNYLGNPVLETDFRLGVGHVKPSAYRLTSVNVHGWTVNEDSLLMTWQSKLYANFQNKELWSNVAAKLARIQKVEPSLPDVVSSLVSDGSAYFDSLSLEDWCGEFGYDADSRAAEALYRVCDDIGRQLQRKLPNGMISTLRETLQDL